MYCCRKLVDERECNYKEFSVDFRMEDVYVKRYSY